MEVGFELDVREYKFKNVKCTNCDHSIMQRVQAEVDVAIATKIIDLSAMEEVETITLLAGDRDFFDSLQYAIKKYNKNITIVSFKNTMA